jgi:hypothetical protein
MYSRIAVKLLGLVLLCGLFLILPGQGREEPARKVPKTEQAWTFDEALEQLQRTPRDPYLQYVAYQLARRQKDSATAVAEVEDLLQHLGPRDESRRGQVDLFSIFTGSLAVQESLQLDALRASNPDPGKTSGVYLKPVHETHFKEVTETRKTERGEEYTVTKKVPYTVTKMVPVAPADNRDPALRDEEQKQRDAAEKRRKEIVEVASLQGPDVKSHPWKRMLKGRKPEVSPLAKLVPADCWYAEFRSLGKMLEALDLADQWGTHLVNQAVREARTQQVGERVRRQLALEVEPALRPFYDLAVEEVAVAGNDLFLREGSDVTLLFRMKQPALFKERVNSFLARAEKGLKDAKRSAGTFLGIDFVHVTTPDREVHVYSAYPRPDLHVRSNSLAGFRRIVEAIQGKQADGKPVVRLGDTDEFAYIRTLMPRGVAEEDGFIYLSDSFIRKQVSARVKLTERHRMLCYNHLRMIGHGSMMYRTQFGKAPASLAELARSGCAPGLFGEGLLACPDGGKYGVSAEGSFGTCTHHGHAHSLNPCCEGYLAKVSGTEADEYLDFVKGYNEYWKTYFDPIAMRLQITPQRYRIETIILPLIDNSIYSALATAFGGAPEPLDALPVPKKNIFTLSLRLNKEKLLKEMDAALEKAEGAASPAELARALGVPQKDLDRVSMKSFRELLDKGLGNQIAVHVYDAVPIVDVNLSSLLGAFLSSRPGNAETELTMLGVAALAASLSSPVYVSIPVKDGEIVDRFLESLDPLLTNRIQAQGLEQDFYFLRKDRELTLRGNAFRFGAVKVRFFTGRIGDAFYIVICNKPFILDDLVALEAARKSGAVKPNDAGPVGHAMVRLRPENWNQVLPDLHLGWAENNRVGCLDNLGPLSNVARSVTASKGGKPAGIADVLREAERLHDVRFFCPEGGHYHVTPDGKKCTCTVHGWDREPRQRSAPLADSPSAKLMREFAGLSATLTFREDGLQAVLVIDRK